MQKSGAALMKFVNGAFAVSLISGSAVNAKTLNKCKDR